MIIDWYHREHFAEILHLRGVIAEATPSAFFNWPETIFKEELALSKTLILKEQNEISCYLSFREDEKFCEIMSLGTRPASRKTGAMTELIQFLQKFAAGQGKGLMLEVHEKNASARSLYLKNGFVLSHQRNNYYKDGASAEVYLWPKRVGCE